MDTALYQPFLQPAVALDTEQHNNDDWDLSAANTRVRDSTGISDTLRALRVVRLSVNCRDDIGARHVDLSQDGQNGMPFTPRRAGGCSVSLRVTWWPVLAAILVRV